jgi:uncharacterized protein (DUF58 family)
VTEEALNSRATSSRRLFDEAFLRKLDRLAVISRRAIAGQLQGERRSPKRGQSVEFADFRPYSTGDDFRRIDWNAYARLERFFIKLFIEEEDLTVHLLLDASHSMNWGSPGKLEYAQRAAGALGYITLAGLDRVTASTISGLKEGQPPTFLPQRGRRAAPGFFSWLGSISAAGETDLHRSLRKYAASATPGPLILFSDLFDDGWADGLHALAARGFEVSVLHILSPDEHNPDFAGDLKLLDSENQAGVEITADYDTLRRYREGLATWQNEIRRFCSARRMHYIPVETTLPLETLLFAGLRQQGVLR